MDLAVITPFSKVTQFLRLKKQPKLDQVIVRLEGVKTLARAAQILAELEPETFDVVRRGGLVMRNEDNYPIMQATMDAIEKIAPLDQEHIEILFSDGDPIDELWPASCGFPMNWDEWDDMVRNPGQYTDDMSLFIFYKALQFGDLGGFVTAAENFGWVVDGELDLSGDEVDFEKMYRMLEAYHLGCFRAAIDMISYDTGNPYFDYNPYDEGEIFPLPPFTIEGVRALAEDWQKAQPILRDYQAALELFKKGGNLPGELFQIWYDCQVYTNKPRRPQTLVEIWSGTEEEAPNVDPFYGPLDGSGEEGEEEEDGD